jgi:iron complex outermembrane recepter protein
LLRRTISLDVRGSQCQRPPVFPRFALMLMLGASTPALAQRTTNNAVTAAEDAFGRIVGSERIGIYSQDDVRGFNPVEAGNVRIEGLYFDQQAQVSNRLVDSTTIKVGYAARGTPFPAPTGIVDLKLEKFEGQTIGSVEFESDERGNISGSIAAKLALDGERLGIAYGQGFRIAHAPAGRFGKFNSHAGALSWHPLSTTEVSVFASQFSFTGSPATPIIFPQAGVIPPRFNRHVDFAQPWARFRGKGRTLGVIAKHNLGKVLIEAGLFNSRRTDPLVFADLLLGTDASGATPAHRIIADRNNGISSTSGEFRLSRSWTGPALSHRVQMSLKGRDQSRAFGGQISIPLGPFQVGQKKDSPRPFIPDNPNDHSAVRQFTLGLGYDVALKNRGSFSVAIQKSDYRKDTDFANPALPIARTRDKPLLYSASGTVVIAPGLLAYGGMIRGLEESPVAPDIATNRGEAPPAIRTRQKEAGLRYVIAPKLTLIAGVFELRKPYYNIDSDLRFGQLGTLSNRGVELSLAGTLVPGLTLVAGTLLLDPRISGTAVASGRLVSRPVGSFKRRSVANLDWKPKGQSAWSFDVALDSVSREAASANPSTRFSGPARELIGLGARYRFEIGDVKLLARGQIQNVLNDYGRKVSSSGGFSATLARTVLMNLSADF